MFQKLLNFASQEKIPVTARGGGYGYVGGCVPVRKGIALSLIRMNRIKEIHFADAIAVVEPGVITADLKAAARAQKLFYPPDPASMKDCTIGGNVATNAGGPRCLKYGVTRNYVIGLEVVLADGEVLRTGGRVHKDKTGFNLIGLFVGSEGMLGVVTEITLRLLPLPPARATLSAAFSTMPQAAAAVQEIFAAGFLPSSLEIADSFTLEAAEKISAKRSSRRAARIFWLILMGRRKACGAKRKRFAICWPRKSRIRSKWPPVKTDCEKLWALRREFSNSLARDGPDETEPGRGCAPGPHRRSRRVCRKAPGETSAFRSPVLAMPVTETFTSISWRTIIRDAAVRERVDHALDELFAQVLAWGGVITGEHGIGLAKKRWWPEATSEIVRDVHCRIKRHSIRREF